MSDSMYQTRMLDYYPLVIQRIKEFQAIIHGEAPEFELLDQNIESVLDDSHFSTMSESRITQWENILGIDPLEDSSLDDRRETIMARIRGQGKLNTALINSIVKTFTGGSAVSWVEDSVLHVEITPPPNNKQYRFANVQQELAKKVPAHLGLHVERNYYDWGDVKANNATWDVLNTTFNNWNEVLLHIKG